MLTAFAVQSLSPGAQGPEFIIVGAENPQDALGAAARQCVEEGKEDAQLIAVFTSEDLAMLSAQMDTAKKQLAERS